MLTDTETNTSPYCFGKIILQCQNQTATARNGWLVCKHLKERRLYSYIKLVDVQETASGDNSNKALSKILIYSLNVWSTHLLLQGLFHLWYTAQRTVFTRSTVQRFVRTMETLQASNCCKCPMLQRKIYRNAQGDGNKVSLKQICVCLGLKETTDTII